MIPFGCSGRALWANALINHYKSHMLEKQIMEKDR